MAEYIEFSLSKTSKTVPIFAMAYDNYIRIDVPGLDESCVNDFTTDVEESAQSWLSASGFSYIIPTFNNEVIEDAAPYVVARFDVTENTDEERTGIITISHVGGWSGTYTVTQKAGLTVDDIPADAYKEIVPGTTPWFSTRNQENFPDYNWDRAEKVLYMTGDCLLKPSASLYVPESWVTEDTIVRCCIEADENSRNTISDWLYDFGEDNGWWTSTDYPGFKHYGYDVGSRYTFEMTNVTHRTVKLTFVLCNYNGETGNYFAVPFRIVQCKKGITKAEFDEIVKMYGPSNFDGTMNNLDRFGFKDDAESTDQTVVPGVTPWVEIPDREIKNVAVYPFSESDRFVANYGKADKVLYVPHILPLQQPSLNVYIPKSHILDNTSISVSYETNEYNPSESRLSNIFDINAVNGSLTNWKDSTDYPNFKYKSVSFKDIRLYSTTNWQSDKPAYCKLYFTIDNYGEIGKQFVIPFTLVCFMESVPTKAKFNETVNTYGASNYDGTMQNLDMFHFDALAKNPYLQICPNCLKFKYDSNSHLCSHCDYSDTYKPKGGLPYFAIAGVVSNHAYFSKSKGYCLCNVTGGTNGGKPDGFPSEIYFPSSLGISNNEEITVNYNIVPIYPAGSNTDWVKIQVSNELSSNDSKGCSIPLNIDIALNNKSGNDYRVAKIVFTITAPVNGTTVTYKDATLEYTLIQAGCNRGPSIPGLKEIYGTEYHKSLYVQPDNMKPYPDPSTPSTPETPSTPDPGFTGNLTFRESEMNVPASTYTNVAILNAKGLKKTDLSKISIVSSENWISNIVKTYKTNINGDAYLWITFKTDENTGDARTGNINVSINGKTAMLKINQVAVEDTTTDTTNDLTTVPRFDGENNISVKSDAKTNTATLNVWDMTEKECTDKVTVRTNAAWIKNLNIKYVKKDK